MSRLKHRVKKWKVKVLNKKPIQQVSFTKRIDKPRNFMASIFPEWIDDLSQLVFRVH